MNNDFKPCPFCGSNGASLTETRQYGHGDSTCQVYVECNTCRAKGPDAGFWGSPTDEQRQSAVEKWNNRI